MKALVRSVSKLYIVTKEKRGNVKAADDILLVLFLIVSRLFLFLFFRLSVRREMWDSRCAPPAVATTPGGLRRNTLFSCPSVPTGSQSRKCGLHVGVAVVSQSQRLQPVVHLPPRRPLWLLAAGRARRQEQFSHKFSQEVPRLTRGHLNRTRTRIMSFNWNHEFEVES